jgi:hypothetical protein
VGRGEAERSPRLYRALTQAMLVGPARLGLGIVAVALAIISGLDAGRATAEAAAGAGLTIFALVVPGGRRPPWRSPDEPGPMPSQARIEQWWQTLAFAMFPSTYGVAILAAVALSFSDGLVAFLGGVLVGIGLLTFVVAARLRAWERTERARLFVERTAAARRFAVR